MFRRKQSLMNPKPYRGDQAHKTSQNIPMGRSQISIAQIDKPRRLIYFPCTIGKVCMLAEDAVLTLEVGVESADDEICQHSDHVSLFAPPRRRQLEGSKADEALRHAAHHRTGLLLDVAATWAQRKACQHMSLLQPASESCDQIAFSRCCFPSSQNVHFFAKCSTL